MRNHLQAIQCEACGATFGQQSQFNEHKNRKTQCKPPKEGITPVSKETKRMASDMTECDNSDEGMMYGIMFGHNLSPEVLKAIYDALRILQAPRQPALCWSKTVIPVAANKKEVRHRQLSEQETLELQQSDMHFLDFIRSRISASEGNRQGLTGNVQEFLGPPGRPARRLPPLYTDKTPLTRQLSVELTPADSGYASDEMSDVTDECTTPSSAGYETMDRSYSYASNAGSNLLMENAWPTYQAVGKYSGPIVWNHDEAAAYGNVYVPPVVTNSFEKVWGSDGDVLDSWMSGDWV